MNHCTLNFNIVDVSILPILLATRDNIYQTLSVIKYS